MNSLWTSSAHTPINTSIRVYVFCCNQKPASLEPDVSVDQKAMLKLISSKADISISSSVIELYHFMHNFTYATNARAHFACHISHCHVACVYKDLLELISADRRTFAFTRDEIRKNDDKNNENSIYLNRNILAIQPFRRHSFGNSRHMVHFRDDWANQVCKAYAIVSSSEAMSESKLIWKFSLFATSFPCVSLCVQHARLSYFLLPVLFSFFHSIGRLILFWAMRMRQIQCKMGNKCSESDGRE